MYISITQDHSGERIRMRIRCDDIMYATFEITPELNLRRDGGRARRRFTITWQEIRVCLRWYVMREALTVPRTTLPSICDAEFEEFADLNDRAAGETRAMADVLTIIEGKGKHKYYSGGHDHPFNPGLFKAETPTAISLRTALKRINKCPTVLTSTT
jgi:hypothetical protein